MNKKYAKASPTSALPCRGGFLVRRDAPFFISYFITLSKDPFAAFILSEAA